MSAKRYKEIKVKHYGTAESGPFAELENGMRVYDLTGSAPELLAALKVIGETSRLDTNLDTGENRYYISVEEMSMIRQVLAKAEGNA